MPEFEQTLATALTVLGAEMPIDTALTHRVAAARPEVAPVCAHKRETIKQGDVFVVCHTDGQIHPACECGQGVYYRDTRFLSGMTLAIEGRAPLVLSFSAEHNFFSRLEAMNEAWERDGEPAVRRETMHLGATRMVDGGVQDQFELRNYNAFDVTTTVSIELRADFKDIFEVRGFFGRKRTGTFLHPRRTDTGAELIYQGADGLVRHTRVAADRVPTEVTTHTWADSHETGVRLSWRITVPAQGGVWRLGLAVTPCIDGQGAGQGPDQPPGPIGLDRLEALQARREAGLTRIRSEHPIFEQFMRRGVEDLLTLCSPTADGPYPSAGIPWYTCPFGRDGLITAIQSLPLGPEVAIATLRFLARHQGEALDPYRDEEPGKILHELRQGELASLREVPHTPYYGTIDATPLWLVLLSETFRWTGDLELVKELWPHALRAISWINEHGDADGDGFVEYVRKGEQGLANQGWKDSHDSVIHPDARYAEAPIALAEVQGYVFDAKRRMAELARLLGDWQLGFVYEREARQLKIAFNDRFWVEDGGYYAIALDAHKQPVRSKTSNPGHCLWSGLIDESRVAHVVSSMLAPDMFNGWGIRTMSADASTYNPLSYHNGTVWPHDTTLIAKGMGDLGHKAEANRLLSGLFDTARHFEYTRLPELFCGFARDDRFARPVPYPVACSPQAWAACAPVMLLQAVLGLEADAHGKMLRVVKPSLPEWLGDVTLTGLRVGQAEVDLAFSQRDGRTSVEVLGRRGDIGVEVIA